MAQEKQPHQLNQCHLPSSNSQMAGQICSQQELRHPQSVQQQSHKNRLQEFTQRACLPLPIYHTVNEQGPRHMPKFRTTVEVDGGKYVSLNTFSNIKAAEQEAAKLALEGISNKIKNCASKKSTEGGFPPIHEDKVFCKSILHEYAAKTNKGLPVYDTVRLEGLVPVFVSSLVFDGSKYTGGHGLNKKEAEQLAARAAILSILANSGAGTVLSEIVKSKAKQIKALHECSNADSSVPFLPNSGNSIRPCGDKAIEADGAQRPGNLIEEVGPEALQLQHANKKVRVSSDTNEAGNGIENAVSKALQLQSPALLRHEFGKPVVDNFPQPSLLPILLVAEREAQTHSDSIVSGGGSKSRKKKKKAKNAITDIQMQAPNAPLSQVPPCTMAP